MKTEKPPILKSVALLVLFLASLFAAAIQPPTEPNLTVDVVESTSGGARHLYTFADGSCITLFPAFMTNIAITRSSRIVSSGRGSIYSFFMV